MGKSLWSVEPIVSKATRQSVSEGVSPPRGRVRQGHTGFSVLALEPLLTKGYTSCPIFLKLLCPLCSKAGSPKGPLLGTQAS